MRRLQLRTRTIPCLASILIYIARWLFGLAKRPDATAIRGAVREFLRRVDVLPWDAATSEVYGPARAATQRAGRVLAPMDLLIGSHALSIEAVLVTNDRAFAQIPGLAVEDWTVEHR